MATNKENPATLKYKFRSAITNPTVKNALDAGTNGSISSSKARITFVAGNDALEFTVPSFVALFVTFLKMSYNALLTRHISKHQKTNPNRRFTIV